MSEKTLKSYLSPAQRRVLSKEKERISSDLRLKFETAFNAWKGTWFSGGLAISSDPYSRAVGKEYDSLIALGPAILPLVVEMLADPENFFALQLYDAMQFEKQLLVQYEPGDERILDGEQGRAQRTVQAYFSNR